MSQPRYQTCRWYDQYPRLSFVIRLILLLPAERQAAMAMRLRQFLVNRRVPTAAGLEKPSGHRGYDQVSVLRDTLEILRNASEPDKNSSGDFLLRLIGEESWDVPTRPGEPPLERLPENRVS